MVEAASKFEAGVEAMRQVAIDKVGAWHRGKWINETPLLEDEVHELLGAVIADIRVAEVQGDESPAPGADLLKTLKAVWFEYHRISEERRLAIDQASGLASGNFRETLLQDDCPDPICRAVRESLKEADGKQ